jgi:CubicO group peptidase (beta-lactamase class C family)
LAYFNQNFLLWSQNNNPVLLKTCKDKKTHVLAKNKMGFIQINSQVRQYFQLIYHIKQIELPIDSILDHKKKKRKMAAKKTYIFLLKLLVFISCLLVVLLLVGHFINMKNKKTDQHYAFLDVSDKSVDSVLALLTIDKKLNLIFTASQTDSTKLIVFQTDRDSRPAFENLYFEMVNPGLKLHAVSDTTFLKEYLLNCSGYASPKKFLGISFTNADFKNITDSISSRYYRDRMLMVHNHLNQNKAIWGYRVSYHILVEMNRITDNRFIQEYYSDFKVLPDIIIIDSLPKDQNLPFGFGGLLVTPATIDCNNAENQVLELIRGIPDIYLVKEEEKECILAVMKGLLASKKLDESDINHKIRRTVKALLWMKTQPMQVLDANTITNLSKACYNNLFTQKSIALLSNPDSLIPLKNIQGKKISIIWIGNRVNSIFLEHIKHYSEAKKIHLVPGTKSWKSQMGKVHRHNFCLYVIDGLLVDSTDINQFRELKKNMLPNGALLLNMGNYQNLNYFPTQIACIQTHANTSEDYQFASQAIFGGIPLSGMLPQRINDSFPFGLKMQSPKTRLKYGKAEEVGVDENKLLEIDRIIHAAIAGGAFPGCQVFIAKNGQVLLNKSYGHHTYSSQNPVRNNDLYDLASVTKVSATTLAAMKMISDGKMHLSNELGKFFKDTKIDYTRIKPDTLIKIDTFYKESIRNWKKFLHGKDTTNLNDSAFVTIDTVIFRLTPRLNIFKVPIFDLLKHQSGVSPAVPVFRYMYYKEYWIKAMKEQLQKANNTIEPMQDYKSFELPDGFPDNTRLADSLKTAIKKGIKKQHEEYFSTKFVKDSSEIRLTDNLYFRKKYFDTLWRDIKQLPVFARKVFIYSDINMVLLQCAIDSINKQSIDEYLKKNVYNALGIRNITYKPLTFFAKSQIVPTEQENVFRYGYLHGYVHDPSAALLGGIAGNAGQYASAQDLGILFQMILNRGTYGGTRFIKPDIVDQFISRFDETQRALGFDMPNRKAKTGSRAPLSTFGHSGYTGTCVWVDPENEIVYVFLSNRNHPNAANWRINSMNVRERVHNAIYDALIKD